MIKNIAVICYSTSGGGAERATCMWAKSMLRMGKRILWLYTSQNIGDRPINHPDLTYEYLPLCENRQENLKNLLLSHQIDFCYDINPDDVELLNDIYTIRECGCIAASADHSCYFYPLYTARPNVYLKRSEVLKEADLVTALSPENVQWFQEDGVHNVICMPNYLTFNPNDVDHSRDKVSDHELLFVGRLCNLKSPGRVLKAISELKKDSNYSDIHINFLGRFDNSDVESYLRNQVEELGLQSNVTFQGEVLDVESFFQKAKLLVMASYLEGAPMVINEAKAHALPTIMFSLPYVPGTKESQGVISVPQDDIEGMASAIRKCLEDTEYYDTLSDAALKSLDEISDSRLDSMWLDIFDKLERRVGLDTPEKHKNPILTDTMRLIRMSCENIAYRMENTASYDDYKDLMDKYNTIKRKNNSHLKAFRTMTYLCALLVVVMIVLIAYFL